MKISSAGQPLSRATARNYFLLNQFGTPGLGSFLAGHRFVGTGQILLFLIGFALFMVWFIKTAIQSYKVLVEGVPPQSAGWFGKAGVLTCAAAWLWALVTSLRILRDAKGTEPPAVPPRLSS